MDSSSIQIADTEIAGATLVEGEFRLHLARALIVKTMTGSVEQTLWWQAGALVIGTVNAASGLPAEQARCERGDLDDNEYTYRNMLPIPLESRGRIRLELYLEARTEPLIVEGQTLRLELHDTPKYIKHLRSLA